MSTKIIITGQLTLTGGQLTAKPTPPLVPLGPQLWAWGDNSPDGQLGDGTIIDKSSPIQIGALVDWSVIEAGSRHIAAIKTDNTLWAWGLNDLGQAGDNTTTNRSSPVQVGNLTDWSSVSSGTDFSLALKDDGKLFAWGRNSSGRLGDGTTTNRSSPVPIGSANWTNVSAGTGFSLAVKSGGTLWSWGTSNDGRLGHGVSTGNDLSSPTQIGGLTTWASAVAGGFHSLAIKTNGELWSWGAGLNGYLGLGDINISRSSPVQIGILTDWASVSIGNVHTLAIKIDGSLWAWGNNVSGRLGLGDTNNRSSPVQIGTLTDWSSVSAATNHSLARKTDGSLWSWGDSSPTGQLGHGNVTDLSSPVQIGSETIWTSVTAGSYRSLAIKTTT